jgi:4-amino-4-deoxy-L-arabinose transferase-like glycosyltransferase
MNEPPLRVTDCPRAVVGVIIALLALFVVLCVGSGWNTSPTFDEPFFIGAGYSFLKGDVHAQPTGNLVLAEKWVALPLLAMKIEPPTEAEYHAAEMQLRNAYWLSLFRSKADMFARLRAARAMTTLLGVALALVVFFWSRRMHGVGAGLISLGFCCLCPVVIANSGLATTDIAVTLFFSLAVWTFWTLLHRISVGTVLWCGLAVGGLMATKLSGVLIVPMAMLILAAKLGLRHPVTVALPGRAAREETQASRQAFLLVSAAMAAALVAYLTLWAAFGFRYSFGMQTPTGSYHWYLFEGQPEGLVSNYVAWCREFRLLPEHFLIDIRLLGLTIHHHREFLSGNYSQSGWWYFFPMAWFFKTPISFLIAVLAGLIVVLQACRQRGVKAATGAATASAVNFYEFTPLAVLFVVYLGVTMAGTANIGIRHLLPVYPALFILAGLLARAQWWGGRSGPVLAGALIAWSAGEVWAVYPQTLAYFNEFAGGPKHGWHILVDSSYEWGQDLPAVEKWIARRAGQPGSKPPVYFSYFGSGVLGLFKLDEVVMLPSWFDPPRSFQVTLKPGTYIISATMLESVYNHTAFGPWRDSYESEYQNLTSVIDQVRQSHDSAAFARLTGSGTIQRYDELRLGRLCAWLRKREPDERITYGVLVYELNQAQLDDALLGPPAELRSN